MKRVLDWKLAAAVIAAFVLGSTLAVTHAQTETAPTMTNTITVSGSGEASGTPDIANVQLGIEVDNANAGEALAQANDVISKVTKAVEDVGIAAEDIQTSGFNLYPQNPQQPPVQAGVAQPNAAPQSVTYQAQISISVNVKDLTKIGPVIDAATKAGANTVSGLSFDIADQSKLEAQARTQAVANAHDRAQQLATALNMTLGDPITVNETSGGGVPVPFALKAVASAGTTVNAGQLTVDVNLQITYSMSKK